MSKRDLITVDDFTADEIGQIFEWATAMRKDRTLDRNLLNGKVMALFSEKPSLRTRVTFEVGMEQLGGSKVFLTNQDINIGQRESVSDIARNLERWVDVIVARTMRHATVEGLAKYSHVPVVNALTDLSHPCQAITDLFTLQFLGCDLKQSRLVFVGDGNNVCHSLMLLCGITGTSMTVACPDGYSPDKTILGKSRELAQKSGASIEVCHDPHTAVKDATAIYTDVWTSMGQEDEAEERRQHFQPFQVNKELVAAAGSDPYIMHCLPAHQGEEITHDVFESEKSVVFEQAENRLHAQKAILKFLLS